MARIYTVFTSSGLMGECQIFTAYHPDREIISNERMMAELQARCEGVEFVGEALPMDGRDAIAKVEKQRERIDGVLFFGSPPEGLISLGLPIVAVYPLWGQWMFPFYAHKGEKVVTSFLSVIPDNDAAIFASRWDDIAEKIKLIEALSKMRGLRVLVVTDRPALGVSAANECVVARHVRHWRRGR